MAKLTISDEKHQYLAHLKTLIERNYQVAKKERMICMNKKKTFVTIMRMIPLS